MHDLERFIRDLVREQQILRKEIEQLRNAQQKMQDADTRIHLGRAQTITIAAGVLTPTAHTHVRVGPETGTSDELDTITPTHAGQVLLLFPLTDTTITVKDGTGNITLSSAGDAVLDANGKNVTVMYSADLGQWFQIARNA